MAGSGRHGSGTPRTLTGMTALREVKNAETEVREKKEEAQEEASTILAEARKEARSVLQDSKEDAESEAERIILDARDEAQEEKENILRDAEARAKELRNVSDTRLEEATDAVLERFKKEIGGV